MEHLEAYNRKLLDNILPVHVAEHFLNSEKNNDVSLISLKRGHFYGNTVENILVNHFVTSLRLNTFVYS